MKLLLREVGFRGNVDFGGRMQVQTRVTTANSNHAEFTVELDLTTRLVRLVNPSLPPEKRETVVPLENVCYFRPCEEQGGIPTPADFDDALKAGAKEAKIAAPLVTPGKKRGRPAGAKHKQVRA